MTKYGVLKQKIKFQRITEDGKRRRMTIEVCGRTQEELMGRVEETVNRTLFEGWQLR